ncbi:beta galactosidase jelly roll domain-containing protein [Sphingobacterium sp. WQ 366]|uniref:Beta galactosidase jelly roll domain-containing protein n=2 Tax=Sphingobacterium bovistauri TaxID=2781959 RepID=A0ABS7Z386_9SPHI|nr:beta galactosidase jelly roll domain-containing protein [Sphingobacterium bovistauri]
MLLQRDAELKIWGWADPNEKVTVRFAGKYIYTEADKKGNWYVLLPAQQAGGPHVMEINEIIIRDILIGDVWLCSGQSNMETPIIRLLEKYPEINISNNHMIRYFKVSTQQTVQSVQDDIPNGGKWFSAVASEVTNWTALAYFYAQEAYNHTKVPQGMLVSSLGGSAIESWISQDHLKEFPNLILDRVALDSLRYVEKDHGVHTWIQNDWDDSNWLDFNLPGTLRSQGIRNRGVVYFRKSIAIPESKEGRHGRLYLGTMTDSDSVFINGKFIGSTSYMYPPRVYDIPAGILKAGKNTITIRLRSNSRNGEFIADKEYKLKVDDFEVGLTGLWKYKQGLNLDAGTSYKSRLRNMSVAGSGLYNGMIYPLKNYSIKGVVWYQGESNAGQDNYARYLELLIANWRTLWNNEKLPFLLVQLPNFMQKNDMPSESGWAKIREAQFKISKIIPHTALAVTYDTGEWNDIHPLNKKDIAERLFLGARKIVYNEKVVHSGPQFQNYTIDKDKIILTFETLGAGLKTNDGQMLRQFAIANESKKFFWANAVIKGNKIIVSHPEIKEPKAVRYAWADNPEEANLINHEGLLASPFRTDNWE